MSIAVYSHYVACRLVSVHDGINTSIPIHISARPRNIVVGKIRVTCSQGRNLYNDNWHKMPVLHAVHQNWALLSCISMFPVSVFGKFGGRGRCDHSASVVGYYYLSVSLTGII